MLDGIDNIIDMPLRLNESTPTFQTIRELPGIERRTRSRLVHQLNDGPRFYIIVRPNHKEYMSSESFMQ